MADQIVTNHLISSAYLVEQGYEVNTNPSIGIIPSATYGSGGAATWTYPLELTNVLVTSLDQITVTGANKDGAFGWGQTWSVVYKYETDHLGNAVEGHWIFGSGNSSATAAAVIAFTLIGTTPSVVWKRMNATNGLTSVNGDGNYTTSAADLARVINELELTSTYSLTSQAWKQVSNSYGVNELEFTTTVSLADLLASGVTQTEIDNIVTENDIALTEIKIHSDFTISDGTNSSVFATTDADYTSTTFAAKLTTDLGNTVTVGGDLTTTDSTPYYRLYLQFADAVTLTGMPAYIFNIPFSDFSVGAGGQVNLRNVSLDAQMTIEANSSTPIPFGLFEQSQYVSNIITQTGYIALNLDTSIIATNYGTAVIAGSGNVDYAGSVSVFQRDNTASSGWTQLGGQINGVIADKSPYHNLNIGFGFYGINISDDGQFVSASSLRNSVGGSNTEPQHPTEDFHGYLQVWKRDSTATIGWVPYGNTIVGYLHQDRGFIHFLSGDGTTLVVSPASGTNYPNGYVEVFKYSTPDLIGGTWIKQGDRFTNTDGYVVCSGISYDGTIIAMSNPTFATNNGRVQIFERNLSETSGWLQVGQDIVGSSAEKFGAITKMSKTGELFACISSEYLSGSIKSRVSVYKRDISNLTTGWSPMGTIDNPDSRSTGSSSSSYTFADINIDGVGNTIIITLPQYSLDDPFTPIGRVLVYKYDINETIWKPIITNNPTTGGTDPITGTTTAERVGAKTALSSDGLVLFATSNTTGNSADMIKVYTIPHDKVNSSSSTIPAGNHFINNFVSTIETDLVDYTLSYDASNALITFDGLSQDISMSITSTDTTVFDTSITEITVAANTLPFITYGQPDPTLANYIENGITISEFISNGYTIPQILAGGAVPDWDYVTDANHFDQSYVKGFTSVHGSVVIRNDNKLIMNGELSLGGNLTVNPAPPLTTNYILTSDDLIAKGFGRYTASTSATTGLFYGIIPSVKWGGSDWLQDDGTPIGKCELTGVTVTSLDDIEVTATKYIQTSRPESDVMHLICKYPTGASGGAGVDGPGYWLFGHGTSTYTRAALIQFTLNGTTPSVQWIRRHNGNDIKYGTTESGWTNPDTDDSNWTSSAARLIEFFNTGWPNTLWHPHDNHYSLFDLEYNTTAVQPQGTTSFTNDMTLKSNLFMGEDISTTGNVYVGGDLSVNGQFSGNFADGIIPLAAIEGGGGGGAIEISGSVTVTRDVSFNGPTVDVTLPSILSQPIFVPENLLVVQSNNRLLQPYPIELTNVSINSLSEIEPAGTNSQADSLFAGAPVNQGGVGRSCVYYKYRVDSNGNPLEGNWLFGTNDDGYIKTIRIAFTLNGTTPSVKQLAWSHDNRYGVDNNIDYLASEEALTSLWHLWADNTAGANVYSLDRFSFITNVEGKLQVNQIGFNDGTTMSTHDDNILSGTFAGANAVFKDSTFTSVTCEGAATATTVTQSSDYRIKENVTELNETDTVDDLVPIQYNNTNSGNHEFGLLAHELQEIYPHLVNGEKDGDEYQQVHYNGLIGVLVKEVQELKQRLSLLNNR